ncbi:MAG: pyridoxine 5'-phosphate synthase, partial [Bdellovibrionales bacterium]
LENAKTLKDLGAHRAEIYTEEFAHNHTNEEVLKKYRTCADQLLGAGLELNAGHDLDLNNLKSLTSLIPEIKEVSIGHALVCESLEFGVKDVITKYLSILKA